MRFLQTKSQNGYMSCSLAQLMNASASHQEVLENGPPAQPLHFSPPTIGRAHHVTATVQNPATSEEAQVPNVVYEDQLDGLSPSHAYWIGQRLNKTICGCIRSCTVLKVRQRSTWTGPNPGAAGGGAVWEVTPEKAVVKITKWSKVRDLSPQHMEDPIKEVAAIQYLHYAQAHKVAAQTLLGPSMFCPTRNICIHLCHSALGGIYLAT